MQRDHLPVANQGSVFGLIGSIADGLKINTTDAQLGLVVFLSVLLDLFAAFFVGLIGEEQRFRRTLAGMLPQSPTQPPEITQHSPAVDHEMVISRSDILFQKALDVLLKGDVRCTKKRLLISWLSVPKKLISFFVFYLM
ncbi:MAG: hypothetical protein ACI9RZ_000305 [Sphingobacteriales bacterium]